jgi:hypothetical protein
MVLQGRISTRGIDGISPAAKASRSIRSSSVSNRTGTSNAKPAVTAAPETGALPGRKARRPVVPSSVKSTERVF